MALVTEPSVQTLIQASGEYCSQIMSRVPAQGEVPSGKLPPADISYTGEKRACLEQEHFVVFS